MIIPKPPKAFSLFEMSVVMIIAGIISSLIFLNYKSLAIKASCVVSQFGSKKTIDNIDNLEKLNKERSIGFQNCVNSNSYIDYVTCSGAFCSSCKTLLAANPEATSGTYTIDPDGAGGVITPFTAYCDMETEGGGWTLVLNYLHKANTTPHLVIKETSLPIPGSSTLGDKDESSSPTSWGNASSALLNKFTFTEARFYGKTSGHNRIISFKTSLADCITFFKTGGSSCSGLATNFTPFADHTAYLPAMTNSYGSDANFPLTKEPFFVWDTYHWNMDHSDRWEVDDYCHSACDTYHQIWIR